MTDVGMFLFQLVVLIFSVMIHEVSHGFVAEKLGDPTARQAGRLTLNPIKHIDLFGSILLPLILLLGNSPVVIGWAKPVPYDPRNLKNPDAAAGKIAMAGPISNVLLAVVFGIILRILAAFQSGTILALLFGIIVYINLLLAIFNLFPIPPLDGSKVLYAFLSGKPIAADIQNFLERYGFILLLLLIFFGFPLLAPLIDFFYDLIVGRPFGV